MNRRVFMFLVLAIVPVLAAAPIVLAEVQTQSRTAEPAIIVFYEEGCPGCFRMENLLVELLAEHPDLAIARHEITSPGALDLLEQLGAAYGISETNVPIIFVGKEAIVGAGHAEEIRLRAAIDECLSLGCPSPLAHGRRPPIPWKDLGVLVAFAALFSLFLFLQRG